MEVTEDARIIWSPASEEQRARWKSALNDSLSHLDVTLEHILCRAIFSHDFDLIRACLSKGAQLDCWVHESVGQCSSLSVDLLDILIPAGLDVNEILDPDTSYLNIAVRCNDINLAKYLIQHGADVNKPIKVLTLPAITVAVLNDNAEMVELLMQNGAQINGALAMAAAHRKFQMIDLLLFKYGVDINFNDNSRKDNHFRLIRKHKDFTALHEAAFAGHVDVVAYLLEHGANPALEAEGKTPAMLAREKEHWEVVKLLEK